jgi:hypothetical protein
MAAAAPAGIASGGAEVLFCFVMADFGVLTSDRIAVVAMELNTGCRTMRQQRELARFLKPFEEAGRLIVPD